MRARIKLWLRKRALMALSAIAWHLDDWVHRQQVKLQAEIAAEAEHAGEHAFRVGVAQCPVLGESKDVPAARLHPGENCAQWEARKSGVAPVAKKRYRLHHRKRAVDFDARFPTTPKDYIQ